MRGIALVLVGVLVFVAAAGCDEETASGAVHVITLEGTIGPITERFIDRGIDRAESNDARLAVIELDTPGGLSSSMRKVVKRIESADIPVAVYVFPPGGRAASAGTFITMSAHIAVMAPNTSIGAASAVNADGSDIGGTLGKKVENDSVAFIRGIALLRGRNADWAEQSVREAAAVDQSEAVELDVVDFVATDLVNLLRKSEGRTVELHPGTMATLSGLPDAPRVSTKMTAWEHFLGFLADPTVASLLISLGFLALLIELASPGLILPGTAGVISIALGFVGFDVLPVDLAGIVLIVLGLAMVGAELFVPGGILGVSGVVAIVLGSIVAFRDTPADLRPPVWLAVTLATVAGAAFLSTAMAVARVRGRPSLSGPGGLVGNVAEVRSRLDPGGWVFVEGERWQAVLDQGAAEPGERVRITGLDGLTLRVKREGPHDQPRPG